MAEKYLTERERYQMEILLKQKHSVEDVAKALGRSKACIYREKRLGSVEQVVNGDFGTVKTIYLADVGQRVQDERAKNKGVSLKYVDNSILLKISELLHKKHSPYSISETLRASGCRMSEKTIYNYIHAKLIPDFNVSQMLYPRKRKNRPDAKKRQPRNHAGHKSIEERPKSIGERNEFGHWELDSVESGKGDKTTCLCFTERSTLLELYFKVSGKTADNTVRILNRLERKLTSPVFRRIFKTITVDNGCEFLDCERMEKSYYNKIVPRTAVYYCHPYCSSERGSNENQNRFLRRFIPKGDYISLYSSSEIRQIQDFVNSYPRKKFGGLSSLEYAYRRFGFELSV